MEYKLVTYVSMSHFNSKDQQQIYTRAGWTVKEWRLIPGMAEFAHSVCVMWEREREVTSESWD